MSSAPPLAPPLAPRCQVVSPAASVVAAPPLPVVGPTPQPVAAGPAWLGSCTGAAPLSLLGRNRPKSNKSNYVASS